MITISVWGDDLNGADYNTKRGGSMSITVPPEDYRWHHSAINIGHGKDVVATQYDCRAELREIRLSWLDQFDMVIEEDGAYRWWRWYDGLGSVRWAERRLLTAPLPKVPGFFPSDD